MIAIDSKVFWNDCHRLFGLWSSWLLLVVCVTGVWYLLELWGLNARFPKQADTVVIEDTQSIAMPSQRVFSDMISKVSDYHDMEIKQIILPSKRRNSVTVQGQNDTVLVRDRANNVIFHPTSGEFLSNRFAQNQSIHIRISEAADPLHFGVFYGINTKILYFIFGVALSALAVSGTYLFGIRQAKLHRNELKQVRKRWQAAYKSMSFGKWISLVLILVSMTLAVLIFSQFVLI